MTQAGRDHVNRLLLADWIQAEATVICEYSGSITADYRELIERAQHRAATLGVAWDDALVPDHVYDAIMWSAD